MGMLTVICEPKKYMHLNTFLASFSQISLLLFQNQLNFGMAFTPCLIKQRNKVWHQIFEDRVVGTVIGSGRLILEILVWKVQTWKANGKRIVFAGKLRVVIAVPCFITEIDQCDLLMIFF